MNQEFKPVVGAIPMPNGDPNAAKRVEKRSERGLRAIWQARLALLVMINIAQLWILSGTVEAALARDYKQLVPLVVASLVCWLLALSIFLWWRPASRKFTSTGYLREK